MLCQLGPWRILVKWLVHFQLKALHYLLRNVSKVLMKLQCSNCKSGSMSTYLKLSYQFIGSARVEERGV
jgi:hypothetical protein